MQVNLVASAVAWVPKPRENKYVQDLSLFRFLLRITEPPNSIRQYAVGANGGNCRDDKLKNLPHIVEGTLLDCAEDMLGYRREELKYGAFFDKSTPRFFMSLEDNDDERCTTFEHLLLERSMLRKQLLKALQRAL
ncbi:unnamed protein product [Heligmosomoides polygyrus]|uniref:Ras-GEF domain-containing protein n=1 Tax=Heligmosomoides polygyrus TaxID=6339 RepID=A0A183F9C8_HELPZ|nr:unnamed protein product [Heligmosomoides polygyrus]